VRGFNGGEGKGGVGEIYQLIFVWSKRYEGRR